MAALAPTRENRSISSALKASLWAGVMLAGTGGVFQLQADSIGYAPPCVRFVEARRNAPVRAQIRLILEGLGVSNAGLARALGVSRQTIYNWLNGDFPKDSHQSQLDSLSRAYDVLLPLDVAKHTVLTQPMDSGRNFWQLIQDGADAEALAQRLKTSYSKRNHQRSLMAERIAAKRAKGTLADIASDDLS